MQENFADAAGDFEQIQLRQGIALSLQDMQEHQAELAESRRVVQRRRNTMGYERVDVDGDGNCFFVSLAYSAELPMTHEALWSEVCSYLKTFKQQFSQWFDDHFATFEEYVAHLSRPSSYADDLCCMAAAHLLLRPLKVVTDLDDPNPVFTYEPPNAVSSEAWGPEVVLGYYLKGRHYEGTHAKREA